MTGRNTAGINNEIMITMKYRFFILGLAAALFAACAVNEADHSTPAFNDGEEFYATIEGATTKAYVDDQLRVLWNADDRVSIFNRTTYNRQYRFDGRDGANSGTFVKVPNDDFVTSNPLDYVYSVYPYNSNTEISNDGELTVYLPAEQSYREDSFGLGANTMIAVADDNELMFKNLCGYMTLRLYGTDVSVTSISLKGNRNEPLAGKATVMAGVEAAPELQMDASATQEVTLRMDTPVTLGSTAETATTFWLVVPPTTFEGGITLTVKTADGKVFEKSTTGSLAIARNTRSKMAALEVTPVDPWGRYLTFTSEGTTTVSLSNNKANAPVLYYSTDKTNWTQWDYSELTFTSEQPLYLCGNNPDGFSPSGTQYSQFVTAGDRFGVSGDIMSLIDSKYETTAIPSSFCFMGLFRGCSGLTAAPALPATTLTDNCYRMMFRSCSSLATAPVLPATTLAESCYYGTFQDCTSLTTAPDLPATTLAKSCYYGMFSGCTSLVTAPELPATTLTERCYSSMFYGCTSLTAAPELQATTLTEGCYSRMFYGCTSLTAAPELPATTLTEGCYSRMFYGCTSLTAAPELPATTLTEGCYSSMFYGCTSLTAAPELPATTLAERCYSSMFYGCTSLTAAPELPAATLTERCYYSMFQRCTSLTSAPVLPATSLANNCYYKMFRGCTNLTAAPDLPATTLTERCYYGMFSDCANINHIRCLAKDISANECLLNWLEGVAASGTFVKAPGVNWPTGTSGIPEGWNVLDNSVIDP